MKLTGRIKFFFLHFSCVCKEISHDPIFQYEKPQWASDGVGLIGIFFCFDFDHPNNLRVSVFLLLITVFCFCCCICLGHMPGYEKRTDTMSKYYKNKKEKVIFHKKQ